ncbi:MAG: PEP-CTERM sorting domain-containing protein [Fimbriimonadaceae bacterium]|nr:PEP-CTERM sorting domain-containing protein [Fimbriimonadaceae bacterium]
MMKKTLISTALAVLFAGSASASLQFFSNSFSPSGVSGDGSTMVGLSGSGWAYWTQSTGIVEIGGNSTGRIQASDDGTRFGASANGGPNNWRQFAIYDRGTSSWTTYGDLSYHSGTNGSTGYGISGDGLTVLGQAYYNTTAPGSTAARVNPVTNNDPNATPYNYDPNTVNNGRIQASNFDGTIVGGYDRGTNPGTIWVNGVIQQMQYDFGSGLVGLAPVQDISGDGRWIIGDGNSASLGSAYLYDRINDSYKFAPNPYLANAEIATVTSVSDDGRFVFGRYLRSGFNPFVDAHIFVWDTQLDTITDLNQIADLAGFDRQGYTFTLPGGMSSDGRTFTGQGFKSGNPTQTFYMQLDPVPEPATMSVLGLAAVAILRKRKKS